MQKLSCSECQSIHGVLECYHNGTLVIVEWWCLDCESTTDICSADVQHLLVETDEQENIRGIEIDDSTYVVRGSM
jgi:hypothetical protein